MICICMTGKMAMRSSKRVFTFAVFHFSFHAMQSVCYVTKKMMRQLFLLHQSSSTTHRITAPPPQKGACGGQKNISVYTVKNFGGSRVGCMLQMAALLFTQRRQAGTKRSDVTTKLFSVMPQQLCVLPQMPCVYTKNILWLCPYPQRGRSFFRGPPATL